MLSGSTTSPYLARTLVHRLFEERARSRPNAPAVECGSISLTYVELDRRAGRIAGVLLGAGLGAGRLVAVAMDRTVDAVVAMLGVLKAGGVYVPIEPGSPDEMLRYLLADADPFAVLTHERHRVRVTDRPGRLVLCLDVDTEIGADADTGDASADRDERADTLPPAGATNPLACVVYTSGTTGAPVGATIGHDNLLNAFFAWEEVYQLTARDRHLQIASLEFDVFTADWVRALCSGAVLVMAERNFMHERTADIADLYRVIVDAGITVMECNVRTLRLLYDHIKANGLPLGSVRLLAVGTDRWYLDEHIAVQDHLGPAVRHVNTYGVVEAAVDSTYFELAQLSGETERPEHLSLIGVPFPNTRIHILAEDGTPCPVGEPGEICVTGAGVGRGYWNRPELTDERFRQVDLHPDGQVFRTGDLGRIRPDGILEFLCRAGGTGRPGKTAPTPMEIAGIESALRGYPGVRDALVITSHDDHNDGALVGYLVTYDGGAVDGLAIRSYLSSRLPDQLLPIGFVSLDSLPRNRAGKVDRSRLPRPAPTEASTKDSGLPSFGAAKSTFGTGDPQAPSGPASSGGWAAWAILTGAFSTVALCVTGALWPGSTDVSMVPQPWASLFRVLYGFEVLSFGLGMTFLVLGGRLMTKLGRPKRSAGAAHLATAWLLIAWWPQDNLYRLTAKSDWPRQAAMVYTFNITLMIAAAVMAGFLVRGFAERIRANAPQAGREEDDQRVPAREE